MRRLSCTHLIHELLIAFTANVFCISITDVHHQQKLYGLGDVLTFDRSPWTPFSYSIELTCQKSCKFNSMLAAL